MKCCFPTAENHIQSVVHAFNEPLLNQYLYRLKLKLASLIGNRKAPLIYSGRNLLIPLYVRL
jgi:hypothetical protein